MSTVPVFVGVVTEQGALVLDDRKAFMRHLAQFKGDEVALTCKKNRRGRSNQQNRYWWGVVVSVLAENCGYTNDEMHDALKYKFLRDEAEGPLVKVRSTTTLNTAEMTKLIEDVRLWAETELGCYIPAPNEVDEAA